MITILQFIAHKKYAVTTIIISYTPNALCKLITRSKPKVADYNYKKRQRRELLPDIAALLL